MQISTVLQICLLLSCLFLSVEASRKKQKPNARDSPPERTSRHKNKNQYRNCNFDNPGREKKSTKDKCLPFWRLRPYKCKTKQNMVDGNTNKCHKFEWKIVSDKDYHEKIKPGTGHFLMVSARQTKDKEARAVFETKTFRVSKKNRCLKFKQSVYCSQNCKTHPYGVMRLQVSIEFGKRKGSNPNSIKAWERIDATRPGEWLESSIDITRVLREKKKSRMKQIRIVFEAKRGLARDALVAIDDVRLARCPARKRPVKIAPPVKPVTDPPVIPPVPDGPRILPIPLDGSHPHGFGPQPNRFQYNRYGGGMGGGMAAIVPETYSIRVSDYTDYDLNTIKHLGSPDMSYDEMYVEQPENTKDVYRVQKELACDYKSYAVQINQCIKTFNENTLIICGEKFELLTSCIQDAAYLCAGINDDLKIIKSGELKTNIMDFIRNDLRLYDHYCSDHQFPVYDLTKNNPECQPDFSENLKRCMDDFAKKYFYTVDDKNIHTEKPELCNEWEKNLQCKREEISKCDFKSNLNMLIVGIGNAVQDNSLRSTFCGK